METVMSDITNGLDDEFTNLDFGETDTVADTEFNEFGDEVVQVVEPSADEQLEQQDRHQDTVKAVIHDIFRHSGVKLPANDPIVQLVVAIEKITDNKAINIANNLEANADNIVDNLMMKQDQVVAAFDTKLAELQELLTKLENQKEAIVLDVWSKLEQRVIDKIQNELTGSIKTIAENSNNDVNNERMLLKGGLTGLLVGIMLCAIILFVFT